MLHARPDHPALRPFIELIWVDEPGEAARPGGRERVLPNGAVHLVFRLGAPLRVFDGPDDPRGRTVGRALIGGPRAASYVRGLDGSGSVGAMLRPGALRALFGVDADALAHRHTSVHDLCGAWGAEVDQRLAEAPSAHARLRRFEAMLVERLRDAERPHPAVRSALARLDAGEPVGRVVERTGYSHRHLVALFKREVGLSPKVWSRIRRLRRALDLAAARPDAAWAEVALRSGYADQAHLHRDLVALGGITPSAWRAAAPRALLHVPLPEVRSVQDRGRRGP